MATKDEHKNHAPNIEVEPDEEMVVEDAPVVAPVTPPIDLAGYYPPKGDDLRSPEDTAAAEGR